MPATTPIHAILAVTFAAFVALSAALATERPKPLPQQNNCVYLDYAATCPIYPEVATRCCPTSTATGATSSSHAWRRAVPRRGDEGEELRGDAHSRDTKEITFCSCGSEADNWAIAASLRDDRTHVVVSSIEHPAISRASTRWRSRDGVK